MNVHRNLKDLPDFNNAVIAIGAMDGLHFGHRTIITELCRLAKKKKGESVLMIFHPHPRKVVFPNDDSLKLITTLDEKISLLEKTELDHLVIAPFTIEFSQIDPRVYVEDVLIKQLKAKHVIVGYDHRFGLNRGGDISLLREYEKEGYFEITEIEKQQIDDLHISSTKIREHIESGKLELANKLLVEPYFLSGKIEKGLGIAKDLGYPTANISFAKKDKVLPPNGSYAARCKIDGKLYDGMLYIGFSESLKQNAPLSAEMNLFHLFEEDLYGNEIQIWPIKFLRKDQKFRNKAELLFNISADKIEAQHILAEKKDDFSKAVVAILNYNGQKLLEEYLPSIIANVSKDVRIVVIDNASTDHSITFLEQNYRQIKLIKLNSNKGFAGGYNEGLKQLNCQYGILINSDIRFANDWITGAVSYMDEHPNVFALQPKIRSDKQKDFFEYAGAAGGLLDILAYPMSMGRIFDAVERDEGQYDGIHEIFWASGACTIVRMHDFALAGGFDADFFAHQEEIDLCWRMKRLGRSVVAMNTDFVYHLGGGTLDYQNTRKNYLNFRNNYWMILKNEQGVLKIGIVLILRILLDLVFAFKLLFTFKPNAFVSTLAGIGSGVIGIFKTGKKRRQMAYLLNRFANEQMNKKGRVNAIAPISYYILSKKKFSQWLPSAN